jgi:rubrerythrin
MMMRKLKINRIDFETAFELSSYETTAYLDAITGAMIFVEDYVVDQLEELLADVDSEDIEAVLQAQTDLSDIDRQQLLDAARVEGDTDNRYRVIPKQDSRDGYRDMQEYIWALEDEHLRELLEVAIQGLGAFRRFKDVLSRYPEAQEIWFRFRDEREKRRISDWLASQGVEPEFE